MKIVFMGTPDFAVESLKAVVEAGYDVVGVVTQPDREKGRGREVAMTPVKEYAILKNIPVIQPNRVKEAEAVEKLKEWNADLFVVAAFGQLLSEEILNIPPLGCVNVHASLLPKYRGAAPIQWAILNGEQETGVTIMKMDIGLDTGDILTQVKVPISEKETGESLFDKMSYAGAGLLVETLPMIEAGMLVPVKQNAAEATHVKMLNKKMGKINWEKSALELEHLVRGLNSWPGAYCTFREKALKIWMAKAVTKEEILEQDLTVADTNQGEVSAVTKDAIYIKTGDGYLSLNEIQPESKKRMQVKDFLMGYPVQVGESFKA